MKTKLFVYVICTCLGAFLAPNLVAQTTPTRFQGRALSAESIKLNWIGTGDSFIIQRSTNGLTFTDLITVAGSSYTYTDTGLSASSPYLYKICSVVDGVKSAYTSAMGVATKMLPQLPDITDDVPGVLTVQNENTSNASENSSKLIDNDVNTKYLFFYSQGWIKFQFSAGATITQYAITSANDAPERDPKEWTLEGSNDNAAWIVLDTRTTQMFPDRFSKLHYALDNTTNYKYYRLNIKKNQNGGNLTQIAELQLFADCQVTRNVSSPAAPTSLTSLSERSKSNLEQIMPSSNQIILSWLDRSTNEDYFLLERSTDQINWDWSVQVAKNNTRFRCTDLKPLTTYYFRIKAVNDFGSSVSSTVVSAATITDVPPATIQEDWDVHTELLSLQYYDDQVAIYFDKDMDPAITWPRTVFGGIWKYLKQLYGSYSDPRLYVFFHAGKYSGGHPSTWSRADHHYRNVLDIGTNDGTTSAWQTFGGNNLDLPIHEIGHIMEGASLYINGSPERVIWGDSKFAEIFNYDVYLNNNLSDQAKRWYDMQMGNSDSTTPRTGIFWFRDWYYPIYSQYGGKRLLADFFVQMAKNIPQKNGDYTRNMNWGEFIHFYSTAAGINLKEQATLAFGWTDEWEAQFVKAQADFPAEYSNLPFNIMDDGQSEVNFENTNADQNSAKLFDKNYATNYVADRATSPTTPYSVIVKGSGATVLSTYTLVSADNDLHTSQYDPADWNLYGTKNGTDWILLDAKTAQVFATRKERKTIQLTGTEPYLNYKLEITKLRNTTIKKMYLAELELKAQMADIQLATPVVKADSKNLYQLFDLLDKNASNTLKVISVDGRVIFNKKATAEEWRNLLFNKVLNKGIYLYSLILVPGASPVSGKMIVK